MDSAINTAARALAAGDPLAALDLVALRQDAPGLALRGVAMAQLGELARAKQLLQQATDRFDEAETLARARCVTACSEVALAMRDLGPHEDLPDAIAVLESGGDHANATHARLLELRRMLLLGRIDEAESQRQRLEIEGMPPALGAIAELATAEIAMRRIQARAAAAAVDEAHEQALRAGIPALVAETESARQRLRQPAARTPSPEGLRPLRLPEVEDLLASEGFVVNACRRTVGMASDLISLARRPVLFELAASLASAWPEAVDRETLVRLVFDAKVSESLRARLRVEVGRLRALLRGRALIEATADGFALRTSGDAEVHVLYPPIDGEHGAVMALLADGAPWSTSALALALGVSQRTAQRALSELRESGRVRSIGRARALRWLAPPVLDFTTVLLLPVLG